MTRKDIKKKVDDILHSFWNKKLPVNINSIVSNYNIEICTSCNETSKNKIGVYVPKTSNTPTKIIFHPHEDVAQQRLIVAYLFGYHILASKELRKSSITREHFKNVNSIYNIFIDELLLPEETFRSVVEVHNIRTIEKLATIFQVTTGMIAHRAMEYKYS